MPSLESNLSRRHGVLDWAVAGSLVWVVPASGVSPEQAERAVAATMARQDRDVRVVAVNRIPRGADGRPDLAALSTVPLAGQPELQAYRESVAGLGVTIALEPLQEDVPYVPLDKALALLTPFHAPPTAQDAGTPVGTSLLDGGDLIRNDDDPHTLVDALHKAAANCPDRGVTIVDDGGTRRLDYPSLLEKARRTLTGLRVAGVVPGAPVLVSVASLDLYFPVFWAVVLAGAQPVTVTPPSSASADDPARAKLSAAWEALSRPLLVTDERTRSLLESWDGPAVLCEAAAVLPESMDAHAPDPSDVALLQLSSGSTGSSKVIPVTHRGLVDMATGFRQRRMRTAEEAFVNWLPLDHVGGLAWTHISAVVLGTGDVHSTPAYVVPDPRRWLDILSDYRAAHTWAPNFAYRLVAQALAERPDGRWDLSGMKTWVNGGEQCTEAVMADFVARTARFGVTADQVSMSFGMAETCTGVLYKPFGERGSVRRIDRTTLSGLLRETTDDEDAPRITFLSVGRPEPGVRVRVVGDDGEDVGERRTGRLQIRSSRATPGTQATGPERVELGTFWFDTGDLAFVVDGEVVITGRAKEVLIVNGANFHNHEIEERLGAVSGIEPGHVAVCGIPSERSGSEDVAVFLVHDGGREGSAVEDEVRTVLRTELGLAARYVVEVPRDRFPRTSSGKIQRAALRDALLRGETGKRSGVDGVPDCLFIPVWEPVPRHPAQPESECTTLVVADDLGLAEEFTARLRGDVVVVRHEAGSAVEWAGVLRGLRADDRWPQRLVYLRGYRTPSTEPVRDADSAGLDVLQCYQAVDSQLRAGETIDLVTASLRLHRLGDEEVGFTSAPLAAVSAGISLENTRWSTRHVDLEGVSVARDAADLLLSTHSCSAEPMTAWRGGVPHSRRFRHLPLGTLEAREPLRAGGCYVVAGGFGGIGRVLLDELLDRYHARVVVLGRRGLDEVHDELAVLQARGDVTYRMCDITVAGAVEAAVRSAEEQWQRPLDGVVHLAGGFRPGSLVDEDESSWTSMLAAKNAGANELAAPLRSRPNARFIAFSSLAGIVDVPGCTAYTAANRLLEAFCDHLNAEGIPAHCLSWSPWAGVGVASAISVGDATVGPGGVLPLDPKAATALMVISLGRAPGGYLLGLDPTSQAHVTRITGTPVRPLRVPVARGERLTSLPDLCGSSGERIPVVVLSTPAEPERAADGVRRAVHDVLSAIAGEQIDPGRRFDELGLGSLHLLRAVTALRERLGRDLPVTALMEHPTLDDLVAFLEGKAVRSVRRAAAPGSDRRLAIVGMAVRFPGADDLDAFWHNVSSGVVSTRFPRPEERGGYFTLAAAGALENTGEFDAPFFGMSAEEARGMEESQRLLLQTCYHALEHAGRARLDDLARTGLYAGGGPNISFLREAVREAVRTGGDIDGLFDLAEMHTTEFAVARLAHRLGLGGPAINVQTASSTGATVVHLACQALRDDTVDTALVAVSALKTGQFHGYRRMRTAASATGRSLPFDAAGDGYVRGAGVVALVLKRLDRAVEDGDTVHAVVSASSITNDGPDRISFTTPSAEGLLSAMRQAMDAAGVTPDDVGYVEAQGTGTPVGDLVEFAALNQAFAGRAGRVPLGTVAANIGHTDHCSTLAGLVKAALVVRHGQIPPYPDFRELRAELAVRPNPFDITTESRPWPAGRSPRRALVSGFGTGGSNGQIIVEEPPLVRARPSDTPVVGVLPLSAVNRNALRDLVVRYRDHLVREPATSLGDLVLTAGVGRRALAHRAAIVGQDVPALVKALDSYLRNGPSAHPRHAEATGFVPVFTDLAGVRDACATHAVGREALRQAEAAHERVWGGPLPDTGPVGLLAEQVAWAAVVRSLGIRPVQIACTAGGLPAALVVAGVLDLDDAVLVAGGASVRDVEVRPAAVSLALGDELLLERGTTPDLDALRGEASTVAPRGSVVVRAPEDDTPVFADVVARAYRARAEVDWRAVAGASARRIPLPLYPFQNSDAAAAVRALREGLPAAGW